jgi:hypothetical protein
VNAQILGLQPLRLEPFGSGFDRYQTRVAARIFVHESARALSFFGLAWFGSVGACFNLALESKFTGLIALITFIIVLRRARAIRWSFRGILCSPGRHKSRVETIRISGGERRRIPAEVILRSGPARVSFLMTRRACFTGLKWWNAELFKRASFD